MDSSQQPTQSEHGIDPIWTSSKTARQIYALGEVERVSELTHSTEITLR
jgi:hypothetical protein